MELKEFRRLFKGFDKDKYDTNSYNGQYSYKFGEIGGSSRTIFKFDSHNDTLYINDKVCDLEFVNYYIENLNDIMSLLDDIDYLGKSIKKLENSYTVAKDRLQQGRKSVLVEYNDVAVRLDFDTAGEVFKFLKNHLKNQIEEKRDFCNEMGIIL